MIVDSFSYMLTDMDNLTNRNWDHIYHWKSHILTPDFWDDRQDLAIEQPGKIRILVCGNTGVGKSSLIKCRLWRRSGEIPLFQREPTKKLIEDRQRRLIGPEGYITWSVRSRVLIGRTCSSTIREALKLAERWRSKRSRLLSNAALLVRK